MILFIKRRRLRYEIHFSQVMLLILGFKNMKPNQKVEKVLNYIKGNNLAQIHADVNEIERKVKLMNILHGNMDNIEGVTIVFEYGMHELPKRE